MRQESGDADAAGGQTPLRAAQADRVKADQAEVAGHAQQRRNHQLRPRQPFQRRADLVIAMLVKLPGQRMQGQAHDRQRDGNGSQPAPARGLLIQYDGWNTHALQ
ncbi:hypothetical protein D3C71_1187950 [compost metagenome]